MLVANFTQNVEAITVNGLTQWDKGQKLQITGIENLPAVFQVHFANYTLAEAIIILGNTTDGVGVVDIPNSLLEQSVDIKAYVYVYDADSSETIKTIQLPVVRREKPADFISVGNENQIILEQVLADMQMEIDENFAFLEGRNSEFQQQLIGIASEKANQSDFNILVGEVETIPNQEYITNKALQSDLILTNQAVAAKASVVDVNSALALKANQIDLDSTNQQVEINTSQIGSHATQISTINNQLTDIRSRTQTVKEYGVRIYDNQASVNLERILDSIGMVANAAVGTGSVINDFDTADGFPRRRTVNGYYDETAKKFIVTAANGEPNFKRDGTNGNVWVETERFYEKVTVGAGYTDWSICKEQLPGYFIFPKFKGLNNEELQYGYSGAYEVGTDTNGNPISVSGVNPTNVSHDSGLTLARKIGTRYHMDDTTDIELVRLMMMIEFAKTDSQASIGNGIMSLPNERATCLATVSETAANRVILANAEADLYVTGQTIVIGTTKGSTNIANLRKVLSITVIDASNKALNFDGAAVNITVGNFVTSRMTRTGETDTITASSGTLVNDGKHAVIYRGTENPFGNGFKVVSDVVFKNEDSQIYICRDPRKRATGMTALTADYLPIGYTLATVEGYAKTLGYDQNYPSARMTTSVGGSSTTFLADYFYRNPVATIGLREVLFGGGFAYGAGVGSCCWLLSVSLGDSFFVFAGRLSFTG